MTIHDFRACNYIQRYFVTYFRGTHCYHVTISLPQFYNTYNLLILEYLWICVSCSFANVTAFH